MSYTRVVVGGLLILILCWWFVGSKQYKDKSKKISTSKTASIELRRSFPGLIRHMEII
jgi:hypothetical protein